VKTKNFHARVANPRTKHVFSLCGGRIPPHVFQVIHFVSFQEGLRTPRCTRMQRLLSSVGGGMRLTTGISF